MTELEAAKRQIADLKADKMVLEKYVEELQDSLAEDRTEALQRISEWANEAYPVEAFPEQDLKRANEVLAAAGISMSAMHGQWARHLTEGIGKIAKQALEPIEPLQKFDIRDGKYLYAPCPQCKCEYEMGLVTKTGRLAVQCMQCGYRGPEVQNDCNSDSDKAAFYAWNAIARLEQPPTVIDTPADHALAELYKDPEFGKEYRGELAEERAKLGLDQKPQSAANQQVTEAELKGQVAAFEMAVEIAREYGAECWKKYKTGHGPERANPYWEGHSDGADVVADRIASFSQGEQRAPTVQRETDIDTLRFYAQLFREYRWQTDVFSYSVFGHILNRIADRLEETKTKDPR